MISEIYIFISTLWGVEVAPAGIILISWLIPQSLSSQCAAGFSRKQYVVIVCSFPFREVFFWYKWKWRNFRSASCPRAIKGGEKNTLEFNAVVPHSLILLWRRNRWREEIYIDFDWILCFVILKGHNYFHCEVFMIQQNCFLAKHNRFEACLIVVSCFHFCLFQRRVFCITSVSIICIFLMLLLLWWFWLIIMLIMMIPFQWKGSKTSTLSCKMPVVKLKLTGTNWSTAANEFCCSILMYNTVFQLAIGVIMYST